MVKMKGQLGRIFAQFFRMKIIYCMWEGGGVGARFANLDLEKLE